MKADVVSETKLELRSLRKEFDGVEAVKGTNLVLKRGQFLSLLGPSGCGKSTTLSMIAGFLQPTSGDILVDGRSIVDVPVQRRRIGLVFQDYAIFTKLTVRGNLLFGLEAQKMPRAMRQSLLDEYAEKLDLKDLMSARGGDLNMSEMQRVALARVMVTRPELLLLDEPMSNLDASLRASLRGELKRIQKDLQQTVLYVTHDQAEAMSMSDQIAVMNDGEIQQVGSPRQIYSRPDNRFVAEFIGDPPINIIECTVHVARGRASVKTALHENLPSDASEVPAGDYELAIRPHHVRASQEPGDGSVPAVVKFSENFGAEHVLHVPYGHDLLAITVAPDLARPGQTVHISLDMDHASLIDPDTGRIVSHGREAAA